MSELGELIKKRDEIAKSIKDSEAVVKSQKDELAKVTTQIVDMANLLGLGPDNVTVNGDDFTLAYDASEKVTLDYSHLTDEMYEDIFDIIREPANKKKFKFGATGEKAILSLNPSRESDDKTPFPTKITTERRITASLVEEDIEEF